MVVHGVPRTIIFLQSIGPEEAVINRHHWGMPPFKNGHSRSDGTHIFRRRLAWTLSRRSETGFLSTLDNVCYYVGIDCVEAVVEPITP